MGGLMTGKEAEIQILLPVLAERLAEVQKHTARAQLLGLYGVATGDEMSTAVRLRNAMLGVLAVCDHLRSRDVTLFNFASNADMREMSRHWQDIETLVDTIKAHHG
jgi:hypothetical protein